MKSNIVYILLMSVLTISCADRKLKNYYYPLNKEGETVVYKYINRDNPDRTEYWVVKSEPLNQIMITETYAFDFRMYNRMKEILKEDGAELLEYTDFENDEFNKIERIKANIIKKDVYKWNESSEYSYSIEYVNKYGKITFEKRRKPIGYEEIEINGKKVKTFKLRGDYFFYAVDQNDKYHYYQYSYYAEDIGMIKYERYFPNGELRILELEETMSEEKFETIKNEASR